MVVWTHEAFEHRNGNTFPSVVHCLCERHQGYLRNLPVRLIFTLR